MMIAHRNPYGYPNGKCPSYQLQVILKLKNNGDVYRRLRDNIMELIAKHLDINYPCAKQQTALEAMKLEIIDRYPDIFATEESEKRLYYVRRFVSHFHAGRRYRLNRSKPTKTEVISTPTPTPRTTRSKTMKQQSPDLTFVSESIQKPIFQPISQPLPRPNRCIVYIKSDTTSSSSSYPIDYPAGHRAVYHFLKASLPPMTHLMDILIDFGCNNRDFLLAISSWPSDRIRYILDQLPPGQNGRKLTEMEKFVLQNHFKDYFA